MQPRTSAILVIVRKVTTDKFLEAMRPYGGTVLQTSLPHGTDARHIRVEVSDHTAKLYGHVHSLHEASAARAAAASAPGVATVESHLLVSP